MKINTAYLLLGSNLGKREQYISDSIELIKKKAGRIISSSSLYNTRAWSAPSQLISGQNDYLNQAICLETELPAETLLKELLSVENKLGRTREKKWEARKIDIDILLYDSAIINSPGLIIPHPHLHERRFALVPLNDIAPEMVHPLLNKSIKKLLDECPDELDVSSTEQ